MAESLKEEFTKFCSKYPKGCPDSILRENFGTRYESLVEIINQLLASNRCKVLKGKDGMLMWLVVEEEDAEMIIKRENELSNEEKLVLQTIKVSGNTGVWSKDIKNKTPTISSQSFDKILKKLTSMELIKPFKSVASKHKKMYILFEMEPASLVAGGSWHTDQEFDADLISIVSNFILMMLANDRKGQTAEQITQAVAASKLSMVELSCDNIEELMEMLIYENVVEKTDKKLPDGSKGTFWTKKPVHENLDWFTTTPCGICPVFEHCIEGGIISPSHCIYLDEWLKPPSHNIVFEDNNNNNNNGMEVE